MTRDLEGTVRAALEYETAVNLHRFPIDISVQDGVVVLEGIVENIVAKRIAALR